jgi:colanic acid/amylovoran biosynthesis glycosyltransferase
MTRTPVERPDRLPIAAIYRDDFLPRSETFVRDHLLSLERYEPTVLTGRLVPDGLTVPGIPVRVATPQTVGARMRRAVDRRTGKPVHHLRATALTSTVRRIRPHVLHAHFGADGAVARRAATVSGVPLVVTFHGYDVTTRANHPHAPGGAFALMTDTWSQLMRESAALIAVSRPLRDALVRRGADADKVRVIPCGVDTAALAFTPPPATGPLLFVGRLVEKKGCADIIEALAGMPAPPPLLVLGDGPLRAELEALAARLRVEVCFEGMATSERVAEAMRTARLVVMPSRTAASGDTEGLPVVSLEAQAVGRSIVGYRHSGIPEAVLHGVTGDLVTEGDVPALAAAVLALLDDHDRLRRYAIAGRRHVEDHFELRACIGRVEDVYDEVRAGARR